MADATPDYEAELKAANEAVYKHSLELARLTKELAQANAAQENLLHFISHEVKGYLTKNQAAFAAIVAGDLGGASEALKQMAESALVDTRKGVDTVMDILDASNLKKGTVAYAKKPFDLRASLESVVQDLEPAAKAKGLSFALNPVGGTCTIMGDEDKLRRHVLRNLIDNSIKYTPSGSVNVSLTCGERASIVVSDTGVGITPEDMQRLFTEGGHGAESIKVNVHSTGYGLYIAKQIAEAHGGSIKAESPGKGKGATFTLELPVGA